MSARSHRQKISTTVAPETEAFLKALIRQGQASSLAEAVDHAVGIARRAQSRARLEAATAAYYASLSGEALEDSGIGWSSSRWTPEISAIAHSPSWLFRLPPGSPKHRRHLSFSQGKPGFRDHRVSEGIS